MKLIYLIVFFYHIQVGAQALNAGNNFHKPQPGKDLNKNTIIQDTISLAKESQRKNNTTAESLAPQIKVDSCKMWCSDAKCPENKRNYNFTDRDGKRVYKELHFLCFHHNH